MTVQWTLVAAFLYSEIVFILLLLLPFVSPRVWKSLFRSRIFQAFAGRTNVCFTVLVAILVMFFVESIREMNKYSGSISSQEHRHADAEIQLTLKLFRSQRNYYISGMALFLWLVIRRLIILIMSHADLQNEIEKTMREAQSATDGAERLLKEQNERNRNETAENMKNVEKENLQRELNLLHEQLHVTEEELRLARNEITTVKERALSVKEEYDKLHDEHIALQEKFNSRYENVTKDE